MNKEICEKCRECKLLFIKKSLDSEKTIIEELVERDELKNWQPPKNCKYKLEQIIFTLNQKSVK